MLYYFTSSQENTMHIGYWLSFSLKDHIPTKERHSYFALKSYLSSCFIPIPGTMCHSLLQYNVPLQFVIFISISFREYLYFFKRWTLSVSKFTLNPHNQMIIGCCFLTSLCFLCCGLHHSFLCVIATSEDATVYF